MDFTYDEWFAEGIRRFGKDMTTWATVCPLCGHVATQADYIAAGAPVDAVGFSCIGRWTGGRQAFEAKKNGPCNYAGGGLFRFNPWTVMMDYGRVHHVFAFAEVAVSAAA